jgi:hypothetical protein
MKPAEEELGKCGGDEDDRPCPRRPGDDSSVGRVKTEGKGASWAKKAAQGAAQIDVAKASLAERKPREAARVAKAKAEEDAKVAEAAAEARRLKDKETEWAQCEEESFASRFRPFWNRYFARIHGANFHETSKVSPHHHPLSWYCAMSMEPPI